MEDLNRSSSNKIIPEFTPEQWGLKTPHKSGAQKAANKLNQMLSLSVRLPTTRQRTSIAVHGIMSKCKFTTDETTRFLYKVLNEIYGNPFV